MSAGRWSSSLPATGRSWSCSPTSPGSYVHRRRPKCRSQADDTRSRTAHHVGMSGSATVVTTDGLTKRFGKRIAVDHLTMEIPAGVTAGFIGPNGAGKTTTMGMLLGLVRPNAGTATVLGQRIERPSTYLRRVGALVEGPGLWPALTGTENLQVIARLGGHDERRIPDVLATVGLADRAEDRYGSYSFGMKQRLGIAAALLGNPEVLVLDEPTNGLDPVGIAEMRGLIRTLGADYRTVLVSSHMLADLQAVCDWLIVIDHGQLLYGGPMGEFLAQATVEIVLSPLETVDVNHLSRIVTAAGHATTVDGDHVVVRVGTNNTRGVAGQLNQAAAGAGIVLAELYARPPTLEDHYLSVIAGAER